MTETLPQESIEIKRRKLVDANVLMARQPILKQDNSVYGFEVLYRGNRYDITNPNEGMGATGELLNNIFTCVIEGNMTSWQPLFINVDEAFINSPSFFPSQSEQIVLELLETVPATPKVLNKIKELRQLGFEFALDDYIFEPERDAFLPLVSIVKVDVLSCTIEQMKTHLPKLKEYGVKLLAEKVEDYKMFHQCLDLGFELFQGYYLEKPKIVRGINVSASQQVTLRLLSELTKPDITVKDIAELIVCDPRLAMKIVLLVNSSLFSFVKEVHDIKEAVVMLGIGAVKKWAVILLLASESKVSIELFRTLLVRAKALELFVANESNDVKSEHFTLGLFSGLDAMLGIEMTKVTQSIPLSSDLKLALNEHLGIMGTRLKLIKRIEANKVTENLMKHKEYNILNHAYWQGAAWADELIENVIKG